MGSKESKKGYSWLKTWLQEQLAGEGALRDEAAKTLLESTDPQTLLRWLPRLFRESSEENRKGVLRGLVPLVGTEAGPFLEEVLTSPESGFMEKRVALEQLEKLGRDPEASIVEDLESAEDFVASLSDSLGRVEETDTIPEDLSGRFEALPALYQGVVLRELLRRPPDQAYRFLESVLTGRPNLWEEVLEALEEAPHEGAGRLLQAGHATADKALRKKIRRVHHRRNVRGLPVCPLESEETGEAVWRPPAPTKPEGLLSLPDPMGARMAWVIRSNVRKGMLVFGGWVDYQRGLVKFFVMDPSRKELENYKASLLENPEFTVVDCDAGFCASLLDEAYKQGAPVDPEESEAFKAVRPLLKEVVPAEKPAAPVYAAFPDVLAETPSDDPLGESAALLNEGLLSTWLLEPQRLQPHVEKLEEVSESRIIVHPMQKKERMDALFREIAGELLSDAAYRSSWKGRLEDAAWVFHKKGLEGQARKLARLSRYLEDPERDASRVSFFVELVRRGMEGRLQEKKTEEKQTPSLIVKPT
jgi:hypothetical protein